MKGILSSLTKFRRASGVWDIEHGDLVQEGLKSVGECGSVGY